MMFFYHTTEFKTCFFSLYYQCSILLPCFLRFFSLCCCVFSLQVVKTCKECIEKTEPVLADTHIYLLRMWSTLSEVQAYLQYFNDAAEYARKMVEGYM